MSLCIKKIEKVERKGRRKVRIREPIAVMEYKRIVREKKSEFIEERCRARRIKVIEKKDLHTEKTKERSQKGQKEKKGECITWACTMSCKSNLTR